MEALLRPQTARVFDAAPDGREELRRHRLEARLGYGLALFGDRFIATPELGLGLSETSREYRAGWRLALARAGARRRPPADGALVRRCGPQSPCLRDTLPQAPSGPSPSGA